MLLGLPAFAWVFIGLFVLFCIGLSYCLFGRKLSKEDVESLNPSDRKSSFEEAVNIESEYL